MPISKTHKDHLTAHAVDLKLAARCGVRSVIRPVAGLIFPWHSVGGTIVDQLRLDEPDEDGPKYLWPADTAPVLDIPVGLELVVANPQKRLILIEGTKQHLAAASADPELAIVGMVGCWGWSAGGQAIADLGLVISDGRDVTIVLDADMASNRQVWEAADGLGTAIRMYGGKPFFARTPGSSTTGIDDVLAGVDQKRRAEVLANVLGAARATLGQRPSAKRTAANNPKGPGRFFHWDELDVEAVGNAAIDELYVHADTECLVLWNGAAGCYERDPMGHGPSIVLLGPLYRTSHGAAVKNHLLFRCHATGLVFPERPDQRMIPVDNGLLDLDTLELLPPNPLFTTTVRLAVEWDETATCPTYDAWLAEQMPGQDPDHLHEVIGAMLDLTSTPSKHPFFFGPSRSGKSTVLRLMGAIVGDRSTSAVTLHNIAGEDRFAIANLYGKLLNIAADVSARDLSDPSALKVATGDDRATGNRKFGAQFMFTSRALLACSANNPPVVNEDSNAYFERMVPFEFPVSFAGREDRTIEAQMMAEELPGIFRHWVNGVRRLLERGHHRPPDPVVQHRFEQLSDRVRQWLDEAGLEVDRTLDAAAYLAGQPLWDSFRKWVMASGGQAMKQATFYNKLEGAGAVRSHTRTVNTAFSLRRRLKPSHAAVRPEQGKRASRDGCDGSNTLWPRARGPENGQGPTPKAQCDLPITPITPAGQLVFDLETCATEQLWHRPDFLRIVGRQNGDLTGPVVVDTDTAAVVTAAAAGATLVAHNGFAFDFVALAAHHRLDLLELGEADRLRDTAVLALLADPPESRGKGDDHSWRYELSATARRMGHEGKTDDLARLKRRHKGYDRIPLDDPDYLSYCAGDVAATVHILRSLPDLDAYARREMRLLGRVTSSISVVGFRIDEGLLAVRLAEQLERVARRTAWLASEHGLPLVRKDGKPASAPLRTKEGRPAVVAAFGALGLDVDDWPLSPKGTAPAIGKDVMLKILEGCDDLPDVVELAETVMQLNGEPVAYAGVQRHLVDGRVHPRIKARQASGRLSITDPGLTILGKRSAALLAQRDVFIADPGCVLFAVDLSQIDARAVAALSGCADYGRIFDAGRDLHTEVAVRLWGADAVAAAPKVSRERAKPLSHGYPYGMGVEGLARQAKLSIDEAEAYVGFMVETFPRLHGWMAEVRELGGSGVLLDNGFGRGLRVTRGREHTQAPALLGQGCARDLMMEGVLRLPLDVVPMLRAIVHDELVFSVPAGRFVEVRDAVVAALQFAWSPPDGTGQSIEIIAEATGPAERWGAVYGA